MELTGVPRQGLHFGVHDLFSGLLGSETNGGCSQPQSEGINQPDIQKTSPESTARAIHLNRLAVNSTANLIRREYPNGRQKSAEFAFSKQSFFKRAQVVLYKKDACKRFAVRVTSKHRKSLNLAQYTN